MTRPHASLAAELLAFWTFIMCFLRGSWQCVWREGKTRTNRSGQKSPKKAVVSLETWGGYCAWNFSNKASLLRAELHFLRGEHAEVEKKYKASVLLAYKHHFLHEEGLAMELLGMFYMSIGNKEAAKSSLMGAQACYVRWGANAALDEHLSTL